MKRSLVFIFILCIHYLANAHQPDISSLMIYQQNDKYLLIIKSSLGAFESEIEYKNGKNAYKTPKEFQDLVIQRFEKHCLVKVDNQIVPLINPYVTIGHETTVFAELKNFPEKFSEIQVESTVFEDMPKSICEVILTLSNLPQKQYLLTKENNRQVTLNLMNQKWEIKELSSDSGKTSWIIIGGVIAFFASIFLIIKTSIQKLYERTFALDNQTIK